MKKLCSVFLFAILALLPCTFAWGKEDGIATNNITLKDNTSGFSGIAACIKDDGKWNTGDCISTTHDKMAKTAVCRGQNSQTDGYYKKYYKSGETNQFLNTRNDKTVTIPAPSNGKIYRCVSQSCKSSDYEVKSGYCQKKKCPFGASGTYPECDCGTNKTYNKTENQCEDVESVAPVEQQETPTCPGDKVFNSEEKCVCPDGKTDDGNGNCVAPTVCPSGASGTYPNCDCGTDKNYNQTENQCVESPKPPTCSGDKVLNNKNECVCPPDKPDDGNGNCVAPTVCPSGASGTYPNCKCNDKYAKYDAQQNVCVDNGLKELEQAYNDAKENEQSFANRTLTALTVAATGIGGMQLAQGLSEQKADEAAVADMAAYIATFRCEYANGKSVKAGPEEIELPGGNNQNLMNYRAEYIALAKDLKERKAALGMKAGIESEEILDKTNLGLYDDENIGITSGAEASLYRAQMLNSETDQAKLDDMASTSSKRVKGGAIAAGVGVVGGVLGNSLVNGGLGDKLKELFNNENFGTETRALVRKEETALNNLKKCLKSAGVSGTDDLSFTYFYPSVLSVSSMNCSRDLIIQPYYRDKSASDLFADSDDAEIVMDRMWTMFEPSTVGKLIGYGSTLSNKSYGTNHLRRKMQSVKDKFEKAESTDKSRALDLGINFNDILRDGVGLRNLFSGQSGFDLLGGSGVDMSSLSGAF